VIDVVARKRHRMRPRGWIKIPVCFEKSKQSPHLATTTRSERFTVVVKLHLAENAILVLYCPAKSFSFTVELCFTEISHASSQFQAPSATMGGGLSGGTGQKLTQATIIVSGVAALLASLLSVV